MKHPRLLRGALAAALAHIAVGARAEMTWSSYNSSGVRVAANAAVFEPATNTYRLTIPANSSRTFVTTSFVPVVVTPPASGRTLTPVSFHLSASGGYGAGGSVQNKYTAFGLFSTKGTPPGASGNFTDDTGLWVTFYQQASPSFNSKPSGVKAAAPTCPANLLGTSSGTYGLGTAVGGTGGVIADNQLVDVVFTLVLNSSGTWQIGNSTNATATATNAPGARFSDRATGGATLLRTVYSDASSALSGTQTFDQFGFLFENGTASEVTLSLGGFSLLGPPYLVDQPPASSTVTLGGSLTLVTTAGGNPATYQWQFSADDGASFSDIPDANSASLPLSDAQPAAAGLYRVVVTNAAGSATSSAAAVSVTAGAVAPVVQTAPSGATVLVGAGHTFSVLANGTAPLAYQWERSLDGGATYAPVSDANDASLSLTAVTLADAGLYRVVVTNTAGSATSDPATLVVRAVPAITTPPAGAVLSPGSGYTLSVAATGTPAPSYQWTRDEIAIPGATSAELPLTLSAAISGAYAVTVTNAAGSVTSTPVYVGVSSAENPVLFPADESVGTNPDTPLSLTFAAPPRVGLTGQVRVYDSGTGTLVETINLAALTVKKSADSRLIPQRTYRVAGRTIGGLAFNYFPIVVTGNTARIYLQTKLHYGAAYHVQIDPGVLLDATGATLPALTGASDWNYATKAVAPAADSSALTVAADGTGDFTTVQGALDFIPHSPANTIPRVITVRDGVYTELVHVRAGQNLVTVRGQSRAGAVIAYLNNGDLYPGTTLYHRGVFLTQAADFRLENLTVQNLTPRYGSQAEAFITNNTVSRCTVSRVNLISLQDTVLAGGQVFFTDSYIEGDVDFMWGPGGCFFQNSEIRSINPGYLTQIRNSQTTRGNVYVGCRFTAAPGLANASVVLARIDPSSFPHSECVFIDSAMGPHLKPAGWQLDGGASTAPNVRFWEYGSTDLAGAPLDVSARPTYNHLATGVGGSLVLDHQQIDAATADFLRVPFNVCGFTPAVAPVIDASPASAALAHGGGVTLSVSATRGYPAAAYQWYRGATPLAGATGPTHVIAGATLDDAGDYTVVLTNSAGAATSAVATIGVAAPLVTYASYIATTGLDPATDGAPTANPSGDGLSNLIKFVLGGDPLVAQPDLLPVAVLDSAGETPELVYVYERNIAATAAVQSVEVEFSADLTAWDPAVAGVAGVTVGVTPIDATNERVEVRVPFAGPRGFVRLRVVAPDATP